MEILANKQKIVANQNSNILPPQVGQNPAISEIEQLFYQVMNMNNTFEERDSSFNALLIRCPPESAEEQQLNYLQTIASDLLTGSIDGKKDWIERLVQDYPKLFQHDPMDNTPLHMAAKIGAINSFFTFLKTKNLRQPNDFGQTPVHTAIEHGREDIIRGLLERKLLKPASFSIDVEGVRFDLVTYALFTRQFQICDLLLESKLFDKDNWAPGLGNPLHLAAHYGFCEICNYLLIFHPQLFKQWGDQKNEAGQTPLHLAATQGRAEIIMTLYEQCPHTLEIPDNKGQRPIHAAAFANKPDCVELLVALGCKPEYFRLALAQLRESNNHAMVNFMDNLEPLLDSPDRRQEYSKYPVRWAALKGGGAKGPALIGFLKACQRLGHRFEGYSGTSIGAIVASLSAVGYSPEELEEKFIEQSFEHFLDHPFKGKTIQDLLGRPSIKSLMSTVNQLRKFVSSPLKFGMDKGKQIFSSLLHVTGLCPGEELRKWVEKLIFEKTGVRYLTYGELAERRVGNLPNLPVTHLFVNITSIENVSPELICMNTVDPEWKNHIISDSARSSAGYPGAYQPHAAYIKINGERIKIEGAIHVDGGMVCNNATPILDQVRFIKKDVEGLEGLRPEFNRSVIAAGFLSPPPPKKLPKVDFTIIDLLKGIIDTYLSAEEILKTNPYYETRSIKIPVNVGTISFPSESEKQQMIESGLKVTKEFFKQRAEQRRAINTFVSILSPIHEKLQNAQHSLPTTHPHFSGRRKELELMANTLLPKPDWAPGQPAKELLLHGLEGMGKSVLAGAFADLHRNEFKLIWTIDCGDPEVRGHSYQMLAKAIGCRWENRPIDDGFIHEIHQKLHEFPLPWLLIFDNVQELPARPQSGSILLISRTILEGDLCKVRTPNFEINDIDELISRSLGKANRPLADQLMARCSSHPSRIGEAIRRMQISQFSLSPEEYLPPIKLGDDLIYLRLQQPAAFEFLENLAYLRQVPKLFFEAWMKGHPDGKDPDEIRELLFKLDRIKYVNEGQTLSIRTTTRDELINEHEVMRQSQERFNKAFQALLNCKSLDIATKDNVCRHSFSCALHDTPTLCENSLDKELISILYRKTGKWLWANHDLEGAHRRLESALVLSPDEAQKKEIDIEKKLVSACLLNDNMQTLLFFAAYLPRLTRPFIARCLKLSPIAADGILKILANSDDPQSILQGKEFIRIRSKPREILLEIQGGVKQSHFDKALSAYFNWLNDPAFNLETEGEACESIIGILEQDIQRATELDKQVSSLWYSKDTSKEQRAKLYLRSAEYLRKYADAPRKAEERDEQAKHICPELFDEQAKTLKAGKSEAPPPNVKQGFSWHPFSKKKNS